MMTTCVPTSMSSEKRKRPGIMMYAPKQIAFTALSFTTMRLSVTSNDCARVQTGTGRQTDRQTA